MGFIAIEKKWQQKWQQSGLDRFDQSRIDKKYYLLEMFSYPSGYNLHIGHWYNYAPADTFARFKKMQGFEVFQPMGFDAFGLPAENFAIKTGIHPSDSTLKNVATMEGQFKAMGAMFNWDSEVVTCDPDYYRFTQWLFLQLYRHGLAYQKEAPVNFCTSCHTVIANEQVVDGKCERCGSAVVRKNMTQWFFKITNYAEELLNCLDRLDWPEKTKAMQRNWIGRSEGGEVAFPLADDEKITVFTTRADTLMGVSYVVLAPEHRLVDEITTAECREAVEAYRREASKASEIDRLSTAKEKTGVFTGAYCLHPLSGERIPIYIADYCLVTYGTGAVMGVPAHDSRDYDFASKYGLPIKRVIKSLDGSADELPYTSYGVTVNSGVFDGLATVAAKKAVLTALQAKGLGGVKVNYRLRDWSVSRQRYWGAPIPIIHCPRCGTVPVKEGDLPVKLPYDVDFAPDGQSPLRRNKEFIKVKCPVCGRDAERDADTLDTFVCSSWYYLRYPDNKNAQKPFDKELIDKMLPVDKYVGGAEHACMHLLYARFITKALRDMGYLDFDEPFKSLVHQGTILGSDGEKMSKSKGNVVNPDIYIREYGADVFRLYLMFGFAFKEGGPWNDDGIRAVAKFLERVDRLVETACKAAGEAQAEDKELEYAFNYAVKNVTADLNDFSFNTAVARIMELINAVYKYLGEKPADNYIKRLVGRTVVLMAPFVPHLAEEWHQKLGGAYSVFNEAFPVCDQSKLLRDEIELAVQINSKVKAKIMVGAADSKEQIERAARQNAEIRKLTDGCNIKKIIVVPGRLVNIIV